MNKKLISIAIASVLAASSTQALAGQYDDDFNISEDEYVAVGIGAATGALIAGPVGLVIGGVFGKLYAQQDTAAEGEVELAESNISSAATETFVTSYKVDSDVSSNLTTATESTVDRTSSETEESDETDVVMVASASGDIAIAAPKQQESAQRIKEIITYDLNMDVYFKPGSVDFEPFYARQLSSIRNLLEAIPELQLKLDGYSDRQGSQEDNLQLSVERLDSVKDYFVSRGVDVNRINIQAHGEKNFVSIPGELDSYIFDRRVVLSFEPASQHSQSAVATLTHQSNRPNRSGQALM